MIRYLQSIARAARAVRTGATRVALLLPLAACASTGATFRSGVGDTYLERPPYYAGAATPGTSATLVHLPIAYQRGATQPAFMDPEDEAGSPTAALLRDMNAFLDSLGVSKRVRVEGRAGTPPDVQFGCDADPASPDECRNENPGRPRMRLAVGRPSADWIAWAGAAAEGASAEQVLVLTLEIGQYEVRQSGAVGQRKEVELGTGYLQGIPWLTSLETPVSVLQLTGALMGRDGLAIRIGAEGIHARRTNLLLSGIGAQELLTDDDLQKIRTARREDLPDRPLAWQAALRSLVQGLTGRR
jgi:hypothetical protein